MILATVAQGYIAMVIIFVPIFGLVIYDGWRPAVRACRKEGHLIEDLGAGPHSGQRIGRCTRCHGRFTKNDEWMPR